MSINDLRSQLPDYAKDTKVNLGRLVSGEDVEGLTLNQAYGVALACAYSTRQTDVIRAVHSQVVDTLSDEEIQAAKAAATVMAMNNVYYRSIHLASDKDYANMPAGLRMNIIGRSGIDRLDFELYSLAVSAINGCGMCIDAHIRELTKGGLSKQGVQSSIRIASVLNAAAQAMIIESIH